MKKLSTTLAYAAVLLFCDYTSGISFKSKNLTRIDVNAIQKSDHREVYLQDNLLDSLDSDLCTIVSKIELFQVSQNQLQALDVSSCIDLKRLYAYINKLTSVKLSKPSSLVEVDLSRNKLKVLPDLSSATGLRYLNVAHNQISHLAIDVFNENLLLSVLDLSYNQLTHLTDDLFTTSDNLGKLFMDHNLISTIPDNIFQFCPKLKVVSLSHNNISALEPSLFSNNPLLERLDISSNKLVEMELTGDLQGLVFIDASKNDLFNVTLSRNLSSLQRVDFSNNNLVKVDDQLVGSTGTFFYLDVSYNSLSVADVRSYDLRKKTIILDGNPLLCHGDKLANTVVLSTDMEYRASRMCV